jgi:hypothetical protein
MNVARGARYQGRMRFPASGFLLVALLSGACGPASSSGPDVPDVGLIVIAEPDAEAHDASKRDASHSPHDAAVDRRPPSFDAGLPEASLPDTSPGSDAGTDGGSTTSCVGQLDGTLCSDNPFSECCASVCSDPTTDSNNCGECGFACSSTEYCNAGQCPVTECATGDDGMLCVSESFTGDPPVFTAAWATCCGADCADLTSDNANCGACGKACVATSVCNNSVCSAPTVCTEANSGVACPLPEGGAGTCCSSVCVSGFTTTSNCGSCGTACPTGASCVSNSCVGPDGGVGACPAGTVADAKGACVASTCPAGVSGVACLFGNVARPNEYPEVIDGLCCNGVCSNPGADPNNCGTCGVVCTSGACTNGFFGGTASCVPAPGTPPQDEPCLPPSIWVTSTGGFGQCLAQGCMGPEGYCADNGNVGICTFEGFGGYTCVNLSSDPANCGAIGLTCPSGQTCTAGACSGDVAPCGAGSNGAYCDLGSGTSTLCCAGGGCTNTLTDPNNCGTCGTVCSSNLSCVQGHCEATSCTGQPNASPCGAGATNECCSSACVDTQTDTNNCGSCGVHCVGAETCQGGLCGFNTCAPAIQGDPCHLAGISYYAGDCCGASCVDTTSDPANCGGCNLTCTGGTTCSSSTCQ